MVQPNPATFILEFHAASDRTMITPGARVVSSRTFPLKAEGSVSLLLLHSRASTIADERVSSGEAEKPSKTNLFLAFHKVQRFHGKREPDETPDGTGLGAERGPNR